MFVTMAAACQHMRGERSSLLKLPSTENPQSYHWGSDHRCQMSRHVVHAAIVIESRMRISQDSDSLQFEDASFSVTDGRRCLCHSSVHWPELSITGVVHVFRWFLTLYAWLSWVFPFCPWLPIFCGWWKLLYVGCCVSSFIYPKLLLYLGHNYTMVWG